MGAEPVGIIGVTLLLLAFGLNLIKRLSEEHYVYLIMNVTGAGLAAVYAWQSNALPFVVLEAVWATFAGVRLVQLFGRPK